MTVMFDYTQKSFWGGTWYPYWSLIVISILGGFFGLDHMWLRSPTTGLAKFIINIFGFGIWYFYDLIQILGEKQSVMKNGLSAPIIGPLGIGAGMFSDNNSGGPFSKAPWRFMAYILLIWLPFGFDFIVAGDTYGAMGKFICTVIPLLWPIAIIWGIINIIRAHFMPKTLFTKGTYRMFPINFFMDSNGPSVLGPFDLGLVPPDESCKTDGFVQTIAKPVLDAVKLAGDAASNAAVMAGHTAVEIITPGLPQAVMATTKAVQATAGATQIAANTTGTVLSGLGTASEAAASGATKVSRSVASGLAETANTVTNAAQNIIKAGAEPIKGVIKTGSSLVQEIPKATQELPGIGSQVTSSLGQLTSADGLKKLAHIGGGSAIMASGSSDMTTIALLSLFVVIIGGGTIMAVRRMNLKPSLFDKKNDSDTPPEPRRI